MTKLKSVRFVKAVIVGGRSFEAASGNDLEVTVLPDAFPWVRVSRKEGTITFSRLTTIFNVIDAEDFLGYVEHKIDEKKETTKGK